MTQRRRLDAFLLEAARDEGVEVREGATGHIRRRRGLASDGEPVDVDVVVGADGANGLTARALGLGDGDRPRRRARRQRPLRDASRASATPTAR